jgi:hypothetical protein
MKSVSKMSIQQLVQDLADGDWEYYSKVNESIL